MMIFTDITTSEQAKTAMTLFNASVDRGELLYKPFATIDDFKHFFLDNDNAKKVALLSDDNMAFASGCYVDGEDKAYITVLIVDPQNRLNGIGTAAVSQLEKRLLAISKKETIKYEIVFFNPMNFSWIIPNTNCHDHPNAPGIDVSSGAYIFFKNCGYRDFAYQNSYHVDLSEYEFPAEIEQKISKLKEAGIEITYYKEGVHTELNELFDNLQSEMWRYDIMTNVQRADGGNPVLIVNQNGKVRGFTGPLSVQESGRGFFCGIGVHSDCRGNGAGKVLFSYLCKSLKDMGAGFMTLFTGETNPARNIYEAAGFKIVRTWADMRK